ncbi:MAG: carotenoid oxygenase family protein [Archangium sp.]|nr:carotenoid oxygenase family protein [Archangium sp.]
MNARTRSWNQALAVKPGPLDLTLEASRIEGRVPAALVGGRLLSNGPGWNVIDGVNLHPFDGHGYVRAFSFERDGSVKVTARYVATPAYQREAKSGHFEVRGFATNLAGPFWRNLGLGGSIPRNVANTTIFRRKDRLVAGWEGGSPWALDARTLESRGEETFGGALAGQATLAHFKRDAQQGRLVSCSLGMSRSVKLDFREFDADDRLVRTTHAEFPGMHFAHDFAISPSWYVLGSNPLRPNLLEVAGMLVGRSTLLRSIATDHDAPPGLLLVSRTGGAPRVVRLPKPSWMVHFGNAFERDGALIVDACVFHRFEFGEEFGYVGPDTPYDPTRPDARGPQSLYRIIVPAGATEATWEKLCEHGVDFPRFHPDHEGRQTPALFGATRVDTRFSDPFDSIIRVDLLDRARPPSLWSVGSDTSFVGEPIFVPDPARPEAGHVLALVSHGAEERSSLVVLDALALEKGPLAVVPLPLLPIAFHGDWDA